MLHLIENVLDLSSFWWAGVIFALGYHDLEKEVNKTWQVSSIFEMKPWHLIRAGKCDRNNPPEKYSCLLSISGKELELAADSGCMNFSDSIFTVIIIYVLSLEMQFRNFTNNATRGNLSLKISSSRKSQAMMKPETEKPRGNLIVFSMDWLRDYYKLPTVGNIYIWGRQFMF